MVLMISEHLENVSKLRGRKDKIEYLRKHGTEQLRMILKYAFDPNIEFLLPSGKAPYEKQQEIFENDGMLYSEARRLYLFISFQGKSQAPKLTDKKRQLLFVQLLESLPEKEANLLNHIKDKTMFIFIN